MVEIGRVSLAKTKFLNDMYIYHSVREPGFVYEYVKRRGDYYQCTQCRKLRRTRTVVIRDDVLVAVAKHPEDDHHPDCRPRPEIGEN